MLSTLLVILFYYLSPLFSFFFYSWFFHHPARWHEMKNKREGKRGVSRLCSIFSPLQKKKSFFHPSGVVNETRERGQSTVSGHKTAHMAAIDPNWGPLCWQIASDGTFDGMIERRDGTWFTKSQEEEFCCVMFGGVCRCAHLYFPLLAPSLPPSVSQVLAVHNEAEKERTDAKMKIAKLEDALRYNKELYPVISLFKNKF